MNWGVAAVLLVTSLAITNGAPGKPLVLRRVIRQTLSPVDRSFLDQIKMKVIHNCKSNGLSSSGAAELQKNFDTMKECIVGNSSVSTSSQQDYLANLEDCSRNTIKKSKDCLKDTHKYYPGFLITLLKSQTNFSYKDKSLAEGNEVKLCLNQLRILDVVIEYQNCVRATGRPDHEGPDIPDSKLEFCQKFLPVVECLPKTLKRHCSNDAKITEFFEDYMLAVKNPCEAKDIVQR